LREKIGIKTELLVPKN